LSHPGVTESRVLRAFPSLSFDAPQFAAAASIGSFLARGRLEPPSKSRMQPSQMTQLIMHMMHVTELHYLHLRLVTFHFPA
jgi:hypothetical protein